MNIIQLLIDFRKIFFRILLVLLCLGNGNSKVYCSLPAQGGPKYDLSSLTWRLWGYRPESWKLDFDFKVLKGSKADHVDIPVRVPGSVQLALKEAGIIPDWNIGNNYVQAEWIENRHWLFVTRIPDEWTTVEGGFYLNCAGLDGNGVIIVNGKQAGTFNNTFIPYSFDISDYLNKSDNTLAIVFECPPRYLGQIGYTSKIREWKPRYNYGWDWIPRIVQVGIWDNITMEVRQKEHAAIEYLRIDPSADRIKDIGSLEISAELTAPAARCNVRILLSEANGKPLIDESFAAVTLKEGRRWENLRIKRWWPNGSGAPVLYDLKCTLTGQDGNVLQVISRRVGFKNVLWLPCKDALPEADPWICSINGKDLFLQGVNWTPVRPNFADLKEADYKKLLLLYKDLGINILRVWGGGFPEKEWFYDLCDEMGIMLWQEFPLSSSGLDNYPPETTEEISVMSVIAESYVKRLRHHVSLLLWCGGNELYERGDVAPVTVSHPMIRCMKEVVKAEDPGRRFVPGSPSGPSIYAGKEKYGKKISYDVHGPWTLPYSATDKTMNAVRDYWNHDDALMHSEVGVAGAMSQEMINKYRGVFPALPADMSNMLWRQVSWWIEWDDFKRDNNGMEPENLGEYVRWSQNRQAEGISIALKANKDRFPECGGFIIWMGHDSYPCPVNTSIIDFDGNLKPAALEVSRIWKENK